MIVAFTGHRPNKLYKAYEKEGIILIRDVFIEDLKTLKPDKIISGMALGADTAGAAAAIKMGIPLAAYVPFIGQEKLWPQKSQDTFNKILDKASEVVIVSEGGYSPAKMQIRNIKMTDDCDVLLALWNGSSGGTANCVKYAEKVGKTIVNCWEQYQIHLISHQ